MKTRFALVVIATLSLLSISVAHAQSNVAVTVAAPTQSVAAGRDAVFTVSATGDDPTSLNLDYRVEGGQLSGALSLNETAPGLAQAAVHVSRATAGNATLMVLRDTVEVSRATATFVAGAQLALQLHLTAGPTAAARSFSFEVLNAAGVLVDVLSVGTSGDAPQGAGATLPLPPGDYLVRSAPSHDVAGTCVGGAFYAVTPEAGVRMTLGAGVVASFEVRPCAALPDGLGVDAPHDPYIPAPSIIDEVAGTRSGAAPLPPATGNGQAETPGLSEPRARQLFGLFIAVVALFAVGSLAARFLAHVAPVHKAEKKQ